MYNVIPIYPRNKYNKREVRNCTPHISIPFFEKNSDSHTKARIVGNVQHLVSLIAMRNNWHGTVWGLSEIFNELSQMLHTHQYELLERDKGSEYWLRTAHLVSNLSRNSCNTLSARSLWSIMASASDGRWPIASALPIALVASSVDEVVELLDRFITGIWVYWLNKFSCIN